MNSTTHPTKNAAHTAKVLHLPTKVSQSMAPDDESMEAARLCFRQGTGLSVRILCEAMSRLAESVVGACGSTDFRAFELIRGMIPIVLWREVTGAPRITLAQLVDIDEASALAFGDLDDFELKEGLRQSLDLVPTFSYRNKTQSAIAIAEWAAITLRLEAALIEMASEEPPVRIAR